MTCRQLGGPCDREFAGQTADDVIKAQDRHLKEIVVAEHDAHAAGHAAALATMKGRWKHPIAAMGWYRSVKREFAALPDD